MRLQKPVNENGETRPGQTLKFSIPPQKIKRYKLVKKKKNAFRVKKFKSKSTVITISDKIIDLESEEITGELGPTEDEAPQDDDCILIEKHTSVIIIDDENPDNNNVVNKTDENSKESSCESTSGQNLESDSNENKINEEVNNENKSDVQVPDSIPLEKLEITETQDTILELESQLSDASSDDVEIVKVVDPKGALSPTSRSRAIRKTKRSKSVQETSTCPTENKENQNFYKDTKPGLDESVVPKYNEVKTLQSKTSPKRRRRKRKSADDCVVFLSEEIDLDKFSPIKRSFTKEAPQFIALTRSEIEDGVPPEKIQSSLSKLGEIFSATPLTREGSEILMGNEQQRNELYCSNSFNPTKQHLKPGKRMIIVDASNIAFAHSLTKDFSVKGLEICLAYFEKMGHEVKAVLPVNRTNPGKSTDPQKLLDLHKAGKIVFTPCKNLPGLTSTSYDDRFILQLAVEFDAAVISNDNYRDLIKESPAFKNIIENRVVGYTWCNDVFILPKDPYGRLGPSLSVILNRI